LFLLYKFNFLVKLEAREDDVEVITIKQDDENYDDLDLYESPNKSVAESSDFRSGTSLVEMAESSSDQIYSRKFYI
jgi:hypothetical protein